MWLPVGLTQCCKQGLGDEHMLRLQLRLRLDGELHQGAVWIQVCVACGVHECVYMFLVHFVCLIMCVGGGEEWRSSESVPILC